LFLAAEVQEQQADMQPQLSQGSYESEKGLISTGVESYLVVIRWHA